jgi:hypothetical protein
MRKHHLWLAVAALAMASRLHGQANPDCPLAPTTFHAMRDCYRPVVVFASSAKDPSFKAQQALLEQYADDMLDRNLLYVPVLQQGARWEKPLDAPYVFLNQPELQALRARFHIEPRDFTVILVGEDGGEKFRSSKPISVLKLDALVDAMPMRQEEKAARAARKSQ